MTVSELIELLQGEDQNAVVGAGFSGLVPYANTFIGVKHATNGTVFLDMDEETTTPEELDVR